MRTLVIKKSKWAISIVIVRPLVMSSRVGIQAPTKVSRMESGEAANFLLCLFYIFYASD